MLMEGGWSYWIGSFHHLANLHGNTGKGMEMNHA